MPAKTLTTGPELTDQQIDQALVALPPLPDNVLAVVRHLQAQITELRLRIVDLEAAS